MFVGWNGSVALAEEARLSSGGWGPAGEAERRKEDNSKSQSCLKH